MLERGEKISDVKIGSQKAKQPERGLVVTKEEIKRQDVLLGRSQVSAMHLGNLGFRALIESRLRIYHEATSKSAKTHIVVMVTDCVYEAGGRFLLPQYRSLELWVEVDRRYAREKVGNSLRDGVKLLNSGKKRKSGYDAKFGEAVHFASIVHGVAHALSSLNSGMYNQYKKEPATEDAAKDAATDDDTAKDTASTSSSGGPIVVSKASSKKKIKPPPISLRNVTVDGRGEEKDNDAAYILGVLKTGTDEHSSTDDDLEDDEHEALALGNIQEVNDFDDDASFKDWQDEDDDTAE